MSADTATAWSPTADELNMISEFQCPGCVCGSAPADECESYSPQTNYGFVKCAKHVAGTLLHSAATGPLSFNLGLPKGFCRRGCEQSHDTPRERQEDNLRLFIAPNGPEWDKLNVPVWAIEKDGHLFVRTYLPRKNLNFIDVIKGGCLADIPKLQCPIDVGEFVDEID